jgi:hypothetical protein
MKNTFKKGASNISLYFFIVIALIIVGILSASFINRMSHGKPDQAKVDEEIKKETPTEVIQLNVLNSTGIQGLADKGRNYLRARGFDVVEVGNYSEKKQKSIVIDRVGDLNSALKAARAMGIADSLVYTKKDSTLFLRCSIILGLDYQSLKAFR